MGIKKAKVYDIPDGVIINPKSELKGKEKYYFNKADKFFKSHDITSVIPIITRESRISLRTLDWFATKYSKRGIIYKIDGEDEPFNVHIGYKAELKSYKKKYFDPFCRKKRIKYPINDKQYLKTTVGQLNFFRWAVEKKMIDYVTKHYVDIVSSMNAEKKNKKDKDKKHKRQKKQDANDKSNKLGNGLLIEEDEDTTRSSKRKNKSIRSKYKGSKYTEDELTEMIKSEMEDSEIVSFGNSTRFVHTKSLNLCNFGSSNNKKNRLKNKLKNKARKNSKCKSKKRCSLKPTTKLIFS
jgi:hypothetical protein